MEAKTDYVEKNTVGSPSFPDCFPSLCSLQIVPEIFGNAVDFRKVKVETEIGGFKSKLPALIHVSRQAISSQGFEKIAAGAALSGIPLVVGENSFASLGAKALKEKLKPFVSGCKKSGCLVLQANTNDLHSKAFEKAEEFGANCLELSLGSNGTMGCYSGIRKSDAKEAEHLEKAGYAVLKENNSYACYSSTATISEEELREKLVKYSELELPIWVRVSIGAGITKLMLLLQKIKRENDIPLKCVSIDGYCNEAKEQLLNQSNSCCLPSIALFGVFEDKPSFDIVLSGDFFNGQDIAKAIMFGAKAVELPESSIVSAAESAREGKKNGIEYFSKSLEREMQLLCSMQRVETIDDLHRKKKNLFALSKEASDLFGVSCNPKTFL